MYEKEVYCVDLGNALAPLKPVYDIEAKRFLLKEHGVNRGTKVDTALR